MITKRLLIFASLAFSGTTRGMDTPAPAAGQVTFACDWCEGQMAALNICGPQQAAEGITCSHILCNDCKAAFQTGTPDDRFFWCGYCRVFYHKKNKVCWELVEGTSVASAENMHSALIKARLRLVKELDFRVIPNITADTKLPVNPNNSQPHQQRQHSCQHCHASPEKLTKVTRSLNATGHSPRAGTVSHRTRLPEAYYCQAHENTMPMPDTINNFKNACGALHPDAQWHDPFPKYGDLKELVDNPIIRCDDRQSDLKFSVSKIYPLAFIGLVAIGAIYYYWSEKEEKKDDEEDEQINDKTDGESHEIA
jgi:hypothetical protein